MNKPKITVLCAYGCKRRRNDDGQWVTDERQGDYAFGEVSHGCCPDYGKRYFGKYYVEKDEGDDS